MADETHETKIVITGDEKGATSALSRVMSSLNGVRTAASGVMKTLGMLNWAVQAVQMLVGAAQKLYDKLTETARVVAKLKWDIEMRAAANETARLVGWHEKLAKLMKDELDTLTKQRAVAAIEREGKKDYENGRREAERARQIFEAKTPEEEQALRNRFAAEDEQRERDERKAARKQRMQELEKEEELYTWKAKSLRNNNADIDEQLKTERHNLVRANGNEELAKPIRERIAALEGRRKANDSEIADIDKEAKFRRDQIRVLAEQRDYDGPTAGYWNRKTEEKRRAEEAAKEKAEEEAREQERRNREKARADAERARNEEAAKADKAREFGAFADRLAAQDGVSQNRLTAMGLGSGVYGGHGIATDVKRVVKLLEDEIAATREIDMAAKFGE